MLNEQLEKNKRKTDNLEVIQSESSTLYEVSNLSGIGSKAVSRAVSRVGSKRNTPRMEKQQRTENKDKMLKNLGSAFVNMVAKKSKEESKKSKSPNIQEEKQVT